MQRKQDKLMTRIGLVSAAVAEREADERLALDPGIFPSDRLKGPSHARGVVRDPDASLRIEENDPAVAIHPGLEIVHRFFGDPLGHIPCKYAIGCPLRQNQ